LEAFSKLPRYEDDLVFHGRQSGDYIPKAKTDQISRIFLELTIKAGVNRENFSFYSLRHTFQNVADDHLDFPATMRVIRAAIRRGELEAHQFGISKRPSYRVSREAWEKYLQRHKRGP
jgi:integrase